MQDDRSAGYTAGWYPDPVGVHDLRYHNGLAWTGDVSTDGVRHVSPVPSAPDSERSGTAPLVLGIVSLCLGWIPFVSVIAFGTAIAAVVIGLRRRRVPERPQCVERRHRDGCRRIRARARRHVAGVRHRRCRRRVRRPGTLRGRRRPPVREVDGVTRADGTITNLDDGTRTYTVEVVFDGDRSDTGRGAPRSNPATRRSFVVEQDLRFDDLDCQIGSVKGPVPFGLQLDG